MAISATGENSALSTTTSVATENPNGILGKDDFMQLLLVELQHQDPTEPMDSEKILTQTSQLATLESAENTNAALEALTKSLGSSQQFSTISAIGKTADLGSNAIAYDEGTPATFEVYFPSDIQAGSVEILNSEGQIIQTIDVGTNPSDVYQFDWDGSTSAGTAASSGIYYVTASYSDPDGNALETRMGTYPIESVRFDEGETFLKVGSNYVPLENIKEVY